jgi:hypothetical protein
MTRTAISPNIQQASGKLRWETTIDILLFELGATTRLYYAQRNRIKKSSLQKGFAEPCQTNVCGGMAQCEADLALV